MPEKESGEPMTDPAAARSGAAPQLIEGNEDTNMSRGHMKGHQESSRTASQIRQRLDTRREPQSGTCAACGHRQELPRIGMMTHARAESVWRCEQCHGPISVTVMCGSDEPSPDDDVAWLLQEVAALAAARLACHQQIAVCHDVLSAVNASVDLSLDEAVQAKVDALLVDCEHEACITWNRLAERADAAEAARTALRHDLQALIRAWLADADALPGSELFDAAENRLRACARDLADRLARAEKK